MSYSPAKSLIEVKHGDVPGHKVTKCPQGHQAAQRKKIKSDPNETSPIKLSRYSNSTVAVEGAVHPEDFQLA